jgi:hypothetical protein
MSRIRQLSVFGLKASKVGEEEGREVKWGCYVFVLSRLILASRVPCQVVTLRAWGSRERRGVGLLGATPFLSL